MSDCATVQGLCFLLLSVNSYRYFGDLKLFQFSVISLFKGKKTEEITIYEVILIERYKTMTNKKQLLWPITADTKTTMSQSEFEEKLRRQRRENTFDQVCFWLVKKKIFKWRLILAVMNAIICNCVKKPEKNSGLQRGLNFFQASLRNCI